MGQDCLKVSSLDLFILKSSVYGHNQRGERQPGKESQIQETIK